MTVGVDRDGSQILVLLLDYEAPVLGYTAGALLNRILHGNGVQDGARLVPRVLVLVGIKGCVGCPFTRHVRDDDRGEEGSAEIYGPGEEQRQENPQERNLNECLSFLSSFGFTMWSHKPDIPLWAK